VRQRASMPLGEREGNRSAGSARPSDRGCGASGGVCLQSFRRPAIAVAEPPVKARAPDRASHSACRRRRRVRALNRVRETGRSRSRLGVTRARQPNRVPLLRQRR
jgi:hypothetical protein